MNLMAATSAHPGANARTPVGDAGGHEVLSFRLGAEEYGIDILRVQEIRSYEVPTRIANAPPCVRGVINLRGVIVPIVDLRMALGGASVEATPFTVIVIVNVRSRIVGAIVDAVSDVLALPRDAIRPAPSMASAVDDGHVSGIGTAGERMLILLDIESMMASPALGLLDGAA